MKRLKGEPIAVVGMGCVFPKALNLQHYWQTLLQADTGAQRAPGPEYHWDVQPFLSEDRAQADKAYSGLVGCVDGFQFEASRLNCTEEEAKGLSVLEQWLLTALRECLDNLRTKSTGRGQIIIGGTGVSDAINGLLLQKEYLKDFETLGLTSPELPKAIGDVLGVSRLDRPYSDYTLHKSLELVIRKLLPIDTNYLIVDAACASSLYAVDFGIKNLLERKIDIAYCGGAFAMSPVGQVMFSKLNGLSAKGCFPFDERADGTLFGDGAGMIALKRLSDAIRDQDQIQGVIRGMGMSSDGKGKAVYAPSSKGQVLAIRRAYEGCDIDPKTIQYVEAHATGTPLGDATEFSSLATFFNETHLSENSIALGSVKGLFGHLGWAAGVASLIKVFLSMQKKIIPPQANFKKLNPKLEAIQSPFVVHHQQADWSVNRDGLPRRAAVSGFGFGGTNAHVILEEYQPEFHGALTSASGTSPVAPEIVVVAVGTKFPAALTSAEAWNIVRTGNDIAKITFGNAYPVNAIKYKMIPRAARVTDSTQFMLLDATEQIFEQIGPQWKELRDRADVFVGYMGSLSNDVIQAKRVFWEPIRNRLLDLQTSTQDHEKMVQAWESQIREHLVPASEDSFPGVMPNLLAGRLSNFYDLHGVNVCVNSGAHSFISALELGCQSLTHKQADLALVGAVNFGLLSCYQKLWKEWLGERGAGKLGEGALVFALMRKETAVARGLSILGHLDVQIRGDEMSAAAPDRSFGNLWSANPAFSLFRALAKMKGEGHQLEVIASESDYSFASVIRAANYPLAAHGSKTSSPTENAPLPFYVDRIVEKSEDRIQIERTLDLKRDSYLSHHLVNGDPVLPGMFELEIAVEAAALLCSAPTLKAIENIQLYRFIKVFPNGSTPIRVSAQKSSATSGPGDHRIDVKIMSDFISPKGAVLERSRLHFEATVVFSEASHPAGTGLLRSSPRSPARPILDPYHQTHSAVFLDGIFVTVFDRTRTGDVGHGVYRLHPQEVKKYPAFAQFRVPSLLLDGALRLATGELIEDRYVPLIVPLSIQRIAFFASFDGLGLRSPDPRLDVYYRPSRSEVYSSDGQLVLEATGLQTHTMGYIDTTDGSYVKTLPELKKRRKTLNISSDEAQRRVRLLERDLKPSVLKVNSTEISFHILNLNERLPEPGEFDAIQDLLVYFDLERFHHPLKELTRRLFELGKQISPSMHVTFVISQKWLDENQPVGASPGVPHEHVGLIMGFVKALREEIGLLRCYLFVTDQVMDPSLPKWVTREITRDGLDWFAFYRNGQRWVERILTLGPSTKVRAPLAANSVVLLTGGGRGITAEIAKKLARRFGCTLILLGRTVHRTEGIAHLAKLSKFEFIKWAKEEHPDWSLPKILAELSVVQMQAELQRNIQSISDQGGRVEYYSCDISDCASVEATLKTIYGRWGTVDYLIHGSGLDSSMRLERKKLAEFQAVIDVKVAGMKNLLEHVRIPALKGWINFGSIHGIFGSSGQTDYCAANDCLNTMTEVLRIKHPHVDWVTMNWPAISGAGMASSKPEMAQLLVEQGHFFLSIEDAAALFLRELAIRHTHASQIAIVNDGGIEMHQAMYQVIEKSLRWGSFPMLDHVAKHNDERTEFIRTFDLDRDGYLKFHLASRDASLSASLEFEMALEALACAYPEFQVHEARKTELRRFIKVFPEKSKTISVVVTRNNASAVSEVLEVGVEIRSEFVHASGRLLSSQSHWFSEFTLKKSSRRHGSVETILAPTSHAIPVVGYQERDSVYLSDHMRSVSKRFLDLDGRTYCEGLSHKTVHPGFNGLIQPWELLDAAMLAPAFLKQNQPVGCMPLLTTTTKFYHALNEFTRVSDRPLRFLVRAEPVTEVPNDQFDSAFGKTVLLCPKIEVFATHTGPDMKLCLELEDTYLMAYQVWLNYALHG